jgi:16S rRNA (uracil1498-N3)-methyltransferase
VHARFYAPDLSPGVQHVRLPPEEADHLRRVLRLGPGARVQVFSGTGYECTGRVEEVGRGQVIVGIDGGVAVRAEPSVSVVLAQALLKANGMDHVVRDAVMLGVVAIVPVVSARVETNLSRLQVPERVARWRRIAIASAKQCGRAVVPPVHDVSTFEACLRAFDVPLRLLLAEPTLTAVRPVGVRTLLERPIPASALLLVGPEGGWTDEEVRRGIDAGCVPLTLGPRTLRAEAAPLVSLAAVQCLWGDLDP